MERLDLFEEFENKLKQTSIPEFDDDKILRRLQTMTITGKSSNRRKIKLSILIASILVFSVSSFTFGRESFPHALNFIKTIFTTELKDESGNVNYEYSEVVISESEKAKLDKARSIYEKYSYLVYKHRNALKKNEVELLVITEAYGINGSVNLLQRVNRYNSLDELMKSTTTKFKAPTILPDKYVFKYGTIEYTLKENNSGKVAEDLYQKAVKEDKDYISQKLPTTDEASTIILNYAERNGHNNIIMRIDGAWKAFRQNTAEKPVQVEVIEINGHDILYETDSKPFGKITFVLSTDNKNLTYHISYPLSTSLHKDMESNIIKMIESILE